VVNVALPDIGAAIRPDVADPGAISRAWHED